MYDQLKLIRPLFNRRDKFQYIGLLVLMIVGACLEVLGIGAVPAFVAVLAIPDKVTSIPIIAKILSSLNIVDQKGLVILGSVGLIIVFILKNAFLYLIYSLQVKTTEYHRVRLATRLYSAYLYGPWEFHLQKNSSELLRNINTETKEIITGVINPLLTAIMAALLTLLTVILLIVSTPGVAVVGILTVGGASWLFLKVFKTRLKTYGVEAKDQRKESIKAINQGLQSFVDIRVRGREQYFINVLHQSVAKFARVSRLKQVIQKASPSILEMVAVTGLLCIIMVLVVLGHDINTMLPMIALFGAAIVRLRQSIGQIVSGISQFQFSQAAIGVVSSDLNLLEKRKSENSSEAADSEIFPFEDKIHINNLTYYYPETDEPALKKINLEILRGDSVAFVGSTGSGKSTLINVILGLLKAQTGSISVDGNDINLNLRGWLKHIGYIPQEIVLIDDTIRRNIALGIEDNEIDEDRIQVAVKAAQLSEFIESVPKGLDTMVGERGVRLSGGQLQRVGLARALYDNPDVVIMDEATSALDNRTESLVMQTLSELKEGRTFIIIAHRLSTVKNCDKLFFMKDGEITDAGTYEQLANENSEFQIMSELA